MQHRSCLSGSLVTIMLVVFGVPSLFLAPVVTPSARGQGAPPAAAAPSGQPATLGLLQHAEGAIEGYTLLSPIFSMTTYLIDMEGRVVHTWPGRRTPGHSVYLLDNGHLLRAERDPENQTFHSGGEGGYVCEYTWDGEMVWEYRFASERHLQHHDIEPLPDGNVLLIAWERKSADEAFDAGRDQANMLVGELWSNQIIEIEPSRPRGGEIVWEWHVWDHLVQDSDPSLPHYGNPAEHPELIDINAGGRPRNLTAADRKRLEQLGYIGTAPRNPRGRGRGRRGANRGSADWLHVNSVAYNAELDQILLSVHNLNEIWIIDHGTTMPEAAGHEGGAYGKGGDLLYRWGNPAVWRQGKASDQQLFGQHDATWIEGVGDGGWGVLVFNNGVGRGGRGVGPGGPFGAPPGQAADPSKAPYSSIDLIALPIDEDGNYQRDPNAPYGPARADWSYGAAPGDEKVAHFFSSFISGVQRVPGGNLLICSGESGHLLEITPEGQVVWEYRSPFGQRQGGPGGGGAFRGQSRRGGAGPGGGLGGRPTGGAGGGAGAPPARPTAGRGPMGGSLFRATRILPDHPGLAGRTLEPIAPEKLPQ